MVGTFGIFGETTQSLVRNDFFRWFQLEPTNEAKTASETVYRPSGEAFRALVSLTSWAAPDGALQALTLSVARFFIDDPREGQFARDIVKSFLECAGAGERGLAPLVEEIFFRDRPGPMLIAGPAPTFTAPPSRGFQVFQGDVPITVLELERIDIRLANQTVADGGCFIAQAWRRRPAGWLAQLGQALGFGRRRAG